MLKITILMRYAFNDNLSNITISDLKLWVHLGCSEQEKHHPQCVSFDISINFTTPPKAIISDNIEDAFCYANATDLIEHLAAEIHKILNDSLKKQNFDAQLLITITKLSPPVADIHGGVSFTYSGER